MAFTDALLRGPSCPPLLRILYLLLLLRAGCSAASISYGSNPYTQWVSERGTSHYDHAAVFGDNNEAAIHWRIAGRRLHLAYAVVSSSTGWAAFGLSLAGGTTGADILAYDTSTGKITDLYSTDGRPARDRSQDWTFVRASVGSGYLIVEARRRLSTGDTQDLAVRNDAYASSPPTRIFVAAGAGDVVSDLGSGAVAYGAVRFHGDGDDASSFATAMASESTGYLWVGAEETEVGEGDADYQHFCFSYEDLVELGLTENTNYHVIGFEPVIDGDAAAYVHHFVLYRSSAADVDSCGYGGFDEAAYVWGPGMAAQPLPPEAGLLLGSSQGTRSLMLEIHYSNPSNDQGVADSSGVRLYYTATLRPHNVGMFQTGDPTVALEGEPVGAAGGGVARYDFACPSGCTKRYFGGPVTVFSEVLHMHATGVYMAHEQVRSFGRIVRSSVMEYYDYNRAGGYATPDVPFVVRPGDAFATSCSYAPADGTNGTVFGYGRYDEMCVVFLMYYPEQTADGFAGTCGYDVGDAVCSGSVTSRTLKSEKALHRTFGKPKQHPLLTLLFVVGAVVGLANQFFMSARNFRFSFPLDVKEPLNDEPVDETIVPPGQPA